MSVNKIFQIFYDKLPGKVEEIMPVYDRPYLITCLTPRYMTLMDENCYDYYQQFNHICSDGMGAIKLNKLCGKAKSQRLSFDMTSMAKMVFNELNENGYGLYVLGDEQEKVEKFATSVKTTFANLNVVGFHNGFIKNCKKEVYDEILNSGAKVVIIGMGAPLQDITAIELKEAGFVGTIYTCGGFIHQCAESMQYFPKWVDKLNIRFLYRYKSEKGMFKRDIEAMAAFMKYAVFLLFNLKK